jgi:hemoglobin
MKHLFGWCMVIGLAGCAGQPSTSTSTDTGAAPVSDAAAAASAADALKVTPGPGRADNQLYTDLGGLPAIEKVVDASLAEIANDLRINLLFAEADMPYLRARLVEQICEATGGPCTYTGLSMEEAHSGQDVSEAEFGFFVEDLIAAMTKLGVPKDKQDALLAVLGPMKPQVVGQ